MKNNFLHLKLCYCEFQKYEAMTMSEVGGQPKKHSRPTYSNNTPRPDTGKTLEYT